MVWFYVAIGIFIPFLGTTLGAACTFFLKDEMSEKLHDSLEGFAAGIMVSASFFSLILPALEQVKDSGTLAFIPIPLGFIAGMLFLLILDRLIPHIHMDKSEEGPRSGLKRSTKLFLAVSLHNLPEGMVVGIVFAGWMYGQSTISLASALILAVGIALQNFPEGAIVSMPLRSERKNIRLRHALRCNRTRRCNNDRIRGESLFTDNSFYAGVRSRRDVLCCS